MYSNLSNLVWCIQIQYQLSLLPTHCKQFRLSKLETLSNKVQHIIHLNCSCLLIDPDVLCICSFRRQVSLRANNNNRSRLDNDKLALIFNYLLVKGRHTCSSVYICLFQLLTSRYVEHIRLLWKADDWSILILSSTKSHDLYWNFLISVFERQHMFPLYIYNVTIFGEEVEFLSTFSL